MLSWTVDTKRAGRVVIHYVDAQGDHTVREIMPLALEGEMTGDTIFRTEYVDAHCSVARARRTFRVDRIREISDGRTGEVLDVTAWLNRLPMAGAPMSLDAVTPARPSPAPAQLTPTRKRPWKLILVLLVLAYLIGRFRLIRAAILLTHFRHGLWL